MVYQRIRHHRYNRRQSRDGTSTMSRGCINAVDAAAGVPRIAVLAGVPKRIALVTAMRSPSGRLCGRLETTMPRCTLGRGGDRRGIFRRPVVRKRRSRRCRAGSWRCRRDRERSGWVGELLKLDLFW